MTIEAATFRIHAPNPNTHGTRRKPTTEGPKTVNTAPTQTDAVPQGDKDSAEPADKTLRGIYKRIISSDLSREEKSGLINRLKAAAHQNQPRDDTPSTERAL